MAHIAGNIPYYSPESAPGIFKISYVHHLVFWNQGKITILYVVLWALQLKLPVVSFLVACGLPRAGVPESDELSRVWMSYSGVQVGNDKSATQMVIVGKTIGGVY